MAFDVVRYAYDASDDSSVVRVMSEMPDIYLVVENVMYFADLSGYVMMWPVSGDWSEMPDAHDVSDWSDIPAPPGDGRMWAVNAKYYDESNYGALVPEESIRNNGAVVMALTALHRMSASN